MSNQYLDPNLKVFSLNSNRDLCRGNCKGDWSGAWKMFCNTF